MNDTCISPRAKLLMKHLVTLYIKDGQPIGSKALAQQATPSLSPATVRKVLCDLESMGYLTSPHKSSGRVPTAQGMRFFVDSLLTVHPLNQLRVDKMHTQIDPTQPIDNIISSTSSVLSELTRMVGIVTLPRKEQQILRHVEFISLSENRILVVLILNDQDVQNRIICTKHKILATDLVQASNFLNKHFAGKELMQARKDLLKLLKEDRYQMDMLLHTVVEVASKAFVDNSSKEKYFLSGQENLFVDHDSTSVEQLQKLFEAFTEKRKILELLDKCLNTDGVQMFIGEESGFDELRHYSVVISRYAANGEDLGVLGVIGPTRMPYHKVIPVVDLTAKFLAKTLNYEETSPL